MNVACDLRPDVLPSVVVHSTGVLGLFTAGRTIPSGCESVRCVGCAKVAVMPLMEGRDLFFRRCLVGRHDSPPGAMARGTLDPDRLPGVTGIGEIDITPAAGKLEMDDCEECPMRD